MIVGGGVSLTMGDSVRFTGAIANTDDGAGAAKGGVLTGVPTSGEDGVKAGAEAVNFGDEVGGDLGGCQRDEKGFRSNIHG